jgi:GGDEF domain-containing protein
VQVFDHIDPQKLEQRDAELWAIAIAMIVILAGGMTLLMYPASLSSPVVLSGVSVRNIIYSFCILCLLLVGYLLERHLTVRHLRRQLEEERTQTARLVGQASAGLLESLPGRGQFSDQLQLDFSRAVSFQQPLSLVLAALKPSRLVLESSETSTAFVDAVKAMIRKLRGGDSIYLLAPGVFGILLPQMFADDADRVAERAREGLLDASGANNRFTFELRVVNYPREAASVRDIDLIVASYCAETGPEKQTA